MTNSTNIFVKLFRLFLHHPSHVRAAAQVRMWRSSAIRRSGIGPSPSSSSSSSTLQKLLNVVGSSSQLWCAEDYFRVCALVKGGTDRLHMMEHPAALPNLARRFRADVQNNNNNNNTSAETWSPFQRSLVESVLLSIDDAGEVVPPPAATTTTTSSSIAVEPREHLNAIWELIREGREEAGGQLGSTRTQLIHQHVQHMEQHVRRLSPHDTANLVKALATIHYHDGEHTALLARRCCEVVALITNIHDVCQLYYNLHKLGTFDSLTPIALRLSSFVQDMSCTDVFLVAQALERQPHTSPIINRMMRALCQRAAATVSASASPTFHRAVLAAMERYNHADVAVAEVLLAGLCRFHGNMSELDAAEVLRVSVALGVAPTNHLHDGLLARILHLTPTMDLRSVVPLINLFSTLACDSSQHMLAMLARLDDGAGQLPLPLLVEVMELVSTYPPAKGHVGIVSLAFAASLRADSMDREQLEHLVRAFATLNHFSDDVLVLLRHLLSRPGGMRQLDTLMLLLQHLDGRAAAEPQWRELLAEALIQLAPMMKDGQLLDAKKAFDGLRLCESREAHQRLFLRAKTMQRQPKTLRGGDGGRRRSRYHDPMSELLE